MTKRKTETDAKEFVDTFKNLAAENGAQYASRVEAYAAVMTETAGEIAKSVGVANKATEKIGAEAVASTAQCWKDGVSFVRDAADARSAVDLVELQANYMAKAFGDIIAKASAANDVVRGAAENAVEVAAGRFTALAGLVRQN